MNRVLRFCAVLFTLLIPAFAHADTFANFNFSGALQTGVVGGTISVNDTTGSFAGANFTAIAGGNTYTFNTNPYIDGADTYYHYAFYSDGGTAGFGIAVPVVSLVGYTGSSVCSYAAFCKESNGTADVASVLFVGSTGDYLSSGTLTFTSFTTTAVTPEPSSVVLLGTGALGLIGAARRRFRRS